MKAQALKLHQWMIAPQRVVEITPIDDGYSLSWNTEEGDRLSVIGESLETVLIRAHSLETDACNREELLRMTFTPTAEMKAWTTGVNLKGQYGWWGWVIIDSPMPDGLEFKTPVLPRGWKWEFGSNVKRRFKPSGHYGYLTGGSEVAENVTEGAMFQFTVTAPHKIFIGNSPILDVISNAVAEFERAHFIIS